MAAAVPTTRVTRSAAKTADAPTGYVPTIYGTVLYDNTWTSATKARGVYSFPASATSFAMTPEVTGNDSRSMVYYQYGMENRDKFSESEVWSASIMGEGLPEGLRTNQERSGRVGDTGCLPTFGKLPTDKESRER